MEFVYSDGGRSKYFKANNVGDCVTRAICNATGKDYKEVYDALNDMAKRESVKKHRGNKRSNSRNGVFKETWKRYLKEIGWIHHKTCEVGSHKDKLKFIDGALPDKGNVIVQLSRHLTCLKDGVIYDTYDCSKKDYYDFNGDLVTNEERCVYGYWTEPSKEDLKEKQELLDHAKKLKSIENEHMNNTKQKIESIKNKYNPKLSNLEKQIKKLQHTLKIETNRMNKEIKKIKEEDSKILLDKLLEV